MDDVLRMAARKRREGSRDTIRIAIDFSRNEYEKVKEFTTKHDVSAAKLAKILLMRFIESKEKKYRNPRGISLWDFWYCVLSFHLLLVFSSTNLVRRTFANFAADTSCLLQNSFTFSYSFLEKSIAILMVSLLPSLLFFAANRRTSSIIFRTPLLFKVF